MEEDEFEITSSPQNFVDLCEALTENGVITKSAEITMIPQNTVKVEGEHVQKILKLMEDLEDNDDVKSVSSNFDIEDYSP
jgi:transcriptional/translational regulatory protein YebC/TACO1